MACRSLLPELELLQSILYHSEVPKYKFPRLNRVGARCGL